MRAKYWLMTALATVVSVFGTSVVHALDGALDRSFGRAGVVLIPSDTEFAPMELLLQPDGKIVVAGTAFPNPAGVAVLRRFLADGTLDPTFGSGGVVALSGERGLVVRDAALQSDGKIIVGVMVILDGGRPYPYALLRVGADGSLDESFGTGGFASTPIDTFRTARLAVRADDTIVVVGVAGSSGIVSSYTPDGFPDATFDGDGQVEIPVDGGSFFVGDIAIDGEAIVVAYSVGGLWVARYLDDGSLDTSFGADGIVEVPLDPAGSPPNLGWAATSVAVGSDGRVIVGGAQRVEPWVSRMAVVGLLRSGELDPAFGIGGVTVLEPPITRSYSGGIEEVTVQADGCIVVVGAVHEQWEVEDTFSHLVVARLTADGHLDPAFGASGFALIENVPYAPHLALQPDGRIILGSRPLNTGPTLSGLLLMRLNSNANGPGTDPRILPETGSGGTVALLALLLIAAGVVLVATARRGPWRVRPHGAG